MIDDHLQGVPVHVELASLSDVNFMRSVEITLLRRATSLGSNEQELATLEHYLTHGELVYASDSSPRVADMLRRMVKVMDQLSVFKLKRLHVHTLAFQAIVSLVDEQQCVVKENGEVMADSCSAKEPRINVADVNGTTAWLSPRASVARAALAATDWVCGNHESSAGGTYSFDEQETFVMLDDSFRDDITPGEHEYIVVAIQRGAKNMLMLGFYTDARRIPIDDDSPVTCFISQCNKYHICIAPNLVCSNPKVTIGTKMH